MIRTFSPKLKIISPVNKINFIYSKEVLKPVVFEPMAELRAFKEIADYWFIAADDRIIIYNHTGDSIIQNLQIDSTTFSHLLSSWDRSLYLYDIDFHMNNSQNKIAITTPIGLIIMYNLKDSKVDWAIKLDGQPESVCFSGNDSSLIIGTTRDKIGTSYFVNDYYSTIFTLNAENGGLQNYFNEIESVKKISFIQNNSNILVFYDWPATDTFLWDFKNTKNRTTAFVDPDNLQDGYIVNDSLFVTAAISQITLWDIHKPQPLKTFKTKAYGNFYINKQNQNILFLNGDSLYSFTNNLELINIVKLDASYLNIQPTSNNDLVLLRNGYPPYPQKSQYVYYFYNLKKNTIEKKVNLGTVNNLFRNKL